MTIINTIGVDVSKACLDVYFTATHTSKSFSNTSVGIAAFLKALAHIASPFIILEPTGGYEAGLMQKLAGKNIPYARINPYQMRSFARGLGVRAKTDKVDAKMLALYGSTHNPLAERHLSQAELDFQRLVDRRRQLIDMVSQEKCRLEKASGAMSLEIKEHLEYLKSCLKEKDKQIKLMTSTLPKKKALYDMIVAEPGVGDQTAFTLLAYMPELGYLDGKKLAALAGVAPMPHESGTMKREAHIKGGRRYVRTILYMAALSATRFNPKYKQIYRALLNKGKKPKVALTAVMRRLLVVLNAKARDILFP